MPAIDVSGTQSTSLEGERFAPRMQGGKWTVRYIYNVGIVRHAPPSLGPTQNEGRAEQAAQVSYVIVGSSPSSS